MLLHKQVLHCRGSRRCTDHSCWTFVGNTRKIVHNFSSEVIQTDILHACHWPNWYPVNVADLWIYKIISLLFWLGSLASHKAPTLVTPTPSNCCWYLGVENSRATDPLTDQAQLDWLRTNPWNSRIGCQPSAHFLCVWEELSSHRGSNAFPDCV